MKKFIWFSHFLSISFILILFIFLACNRQPTKIIEEHDPIIKKLEERDSIRVIKINKDSLKKAKQDKIINK
ncbi:MAG: hypothetical protein J7L46_03185 [Bacteroidales bacterium]|nr:hypothetical protein [Bacteroidales bacterium]